ncbi:hypothetical protein BamIOP4010DRAFT_5761 [Burkholderia ambifaria IOP40-10]|uniref:Uncharacterized protein n=1 Tax=Burkholderia ambifaria IOP40-10 TaxID=396596 RepID=B1FP00_9BURK|nr:hypothetical protein [Burkholderia ambifaria]EDT00725.1 hypothetical protein BamIOP4010DRAFT_5761 [Burkholderia ambifaria IOP40-10]
MSISNIGQTARNYWAKITQSDRRIGAQKTERWQNTLIAIKNATQDGRELSGIFAQYKRSELENSASAAIGAVKGGDINDRKATLRKVRSDLKEIISSEKSNKKNLGRTTSAPTNEDSRLGNMRRAFDARRKWIDERLHELK